MALPRLGSPSGSAVRDKRRISILIRTQIHSDAQVRKLVGHGITANITMDIIGTFAGFENIVPHGTPNQLNVDKVIALGIAAFTFAAIQIDRDACTRVLIHSGTPVDCPVYILYIIIRITRSNCAFCQRRTTIQHIRASPTNEVVGTGTAPEGIITTHSIEDVHPVVTGYCVTVHGSGDVLECSDINIICLIVIFHTVESAALSSIMVRFNGRNGVALGVAAGKPGGSQVHNDTRIGTRIGQGIADFIIVRSGNATIHLVGPGAAFQCVTTSRRPVHHRQQDP